MPVVTCRTAAGGTAAPSGTASSGRSGTGIPVSFLLYHGTPSDKAGSILQTGFRASSSGQLGAGLYLAREDKAERFADSGRHGSARGVVFAVKVALQNPLYKKSNDNQAQSWQTRGHDGVRVDDTQMSSNMEWCVLPHRATIVRWRFSDEQDQWHSPSDSP